MSSLAYRPEIDGLRAVAVLAVLFFHAGLGFPGGYVGVDVFFVLSGYLITGLILKDLDAGTFTFAGFWERRVRRILPASLVMTGCVLAVGAALLMSFELHELAKSAVAQLCFAANVQFWRGNDDYFATAAGYVPLLHTWSLAVEEQFYFVFPLLLCLLRRCGATATVIALVLLGIGSFAVSVVQLERDPMAAFFLLPSRAWELLLGAGTAWCTRRGRLVPPRLAEAVSIAGMAGILTPFWCYTEAMTFPGPAAIPPCLGCAAVIWANTGRRTRVGRLLAQRPLTAIGLISYSLYLWHWPIFSFYRILFQMQVPRPTACLLAAASLAAGWCSWRFVETPFRERRYGGTRRVLFLQGAAASALLLGLGLWIWRMQGFVATMPPELLADAQDVGIQYQTPRSLSGGELPRLGVRDAKRIDFVFWGDSHAMALAEATSAAAAQRGLAGRAAMRSAFPPVPGAWRRNEATELAWSEFVLDYVVRNRVQHLILAARWSAYVDGYSDLELAESPAKERLEALIRAPGSNPPPSLDEAGRLLTAGLETTFERLRPHGVRIWIVRQVPELSQNYPALRWMRHRLRGVPYRPPEFSPEDHARRQRRVEAAFAAAAGNRPHVAVLDPTPTLFDESPDGSQVIRNGRSLYYDDDHVSAYGARWLTERLLAGVFDEMKREREAAVRP